MLNNSKEFFGSIPALGLLPAPPKVCFGFERYVKPLLATVGVETGNLLSTLADTFPLPILPPIPIPEATDTK